MRRVYLDSNATTPLLPEVVEAVRPWMGEQFGNASSIHHHGQHARAAVEAAREQVAKLIAGARSSEIVFTSGGTEADNLAVFGVCSPGDHIITTQIEHHAVLNACRRLEALGCEVTYLAPDAQCRISAEQVREALRPNTKLVTVMMANNETGVLQPLQEIGQVVAGTSAYFHTDAVQAAGKVPIDVNDIGCHLLTISGHKIHAPQGTGALYVRRGTKLNPLFYGGRHERSRRAGTENVPGLVGLGRAAEIAREGLASGDIDRIRALRDRIEQSALARIDDSGVNGRGAPRVPNTVNIYFDFIEGEALVIALDLKGVAISTGAACSSGAIEPSHVLTAMGLPPERARCSMRFSLGKHNTGEDVDFALSLLPATVAHLRELSPLYAKRRVEAQR